MPDSICHPLIARWFEEKFTAPTEAQRLSWPPIAAGEHTLLAAPTGSGKTLAAFLASIDTLFRQAVDNRLPDETQVVYVSPLKALSHDIRRNLQTPLEEIDAAAKAAGCEADPIRVAVRTGDTPSRERQAMLRRAPHILVTTPESLYLLLTSAKSRENLRKVRTVIVDEIHALARDKRGSHVALSLERLDQLCDRPPARIGLSATQRPIDEIARFLVGMKNIDADGAANCRIIDTGHVRELDLAIEVPPSELSAVCPIETWLEAYARLSELIAQHRSTLVFVNTRRMAERVAHYLEEQLGKGHVASHHGSLSRETRLRAEEQLKTGQLKAIVATASLELGIDIGYIDLVCQIGSPRSIATLLQRVGRAGHGLGRIPKGRLFALTRDELLEAMALVRSVREGRLDRVELPVAPLDILAQQIVAAVACDDWLEDDLFALLRQAWPYRDLQRADFDAIVEMLNEGIGADRAGAYLQRDRIHNRLHGRRSARLAAITSGGAIPEQADYRVVTEGDRNFVGTLNEDFAIESQIGNVFQLGNASWRIVYVRGGEVTVRDAHGAPATVPFWLGEAPARTPELSAELSDLRAKIWRRSQESGEETAGWLQAACGASQWAAQQAVQYVSAQGHAVGLVPTQQEIVFERFFDESGGMQLVIHAPFGARINRAWGLALRKCFCRTFDFELQASADDNGIVLAIGPQHSFPLERMFDLLKSDYAEKALTQALLAVPMFLIRWRWNVTRALAVLRQRGGKKVPPPLQRFRADDLLTAVFPMQTACFEHRPENVEIPNHPLVRQTVYDCLHEAMDLPGWLTLLREIEVGGVKLVARDTREPSPFSHQLVNANVYAFLDDAPLEERRARAVAARRTVAVDDMRDLARLDPQAIADVRSEAWPTVRDADELHDTLLSAGAMPAAEGLEWAAFFEQLVSTGRATRARTQDGLELWVAAERLPLVRAALAIAATWPEIALPEELAQNVEPEKAQLTLVRGRIQICGPVTARQIGEALQLDEVAVQMALEQLEAEGAVLRGQFTSGDATTEWCDRRLLARIHRRTLDGLRRRIEPVEPHVFFRFLVDRHCGDGISLPGGRYTLKRALAMLEGFEAPAGVWEHELLPARMSNYNSAGLDELFAGGDIAWGRLQPPPQDEDRRGQTLSRATPICLVRRGNLKWVLPPERLVTADLARWDAQTVYETLATHGALFADDLLAATSLLPSQLDEALAELAQLGLVTSDSFAAIRALMSHRKSSRRSRRLASRNRNPNAKRRWSLFPPFAPPSAEVDRAERWAWLLIERYGVVFRDLLARETCAPPWRELASVLRRLEMRGEVRGGRFVARVAGEQFALPEAVDRLRQLRDEPPQSTWHALSAADPLNLVGIISDGPRVPATRANRIAFLNGHPVAAVESKRIRWLADLDAAAQQIATRLLTGPDTWRRQQILANQQSAFSYGAVSNPSGAASDSPRSRASRPTSSIG